MVRWHHQFNGHESEQTLGDSGGQRSLACYSPWGRKELDPTEHLNTTTLMEEEPQRRPVLPTRVFSCFLNVLPAIHLHHRLFKKPICLSVIKRIYGKVSVDCWALMKIQSVCGIFLICQPHHSTQTGQEVGVAQ